MILGTEELKELFECAKVMSKFSYSPYSKFPVGCAILTDDNKVFCGVNVENRSFGLTNCAERSAVFSMVSNGYKKIYAVAICAPKAEYPVGPCGACRQVLTEFGDNDVPVIFGNCYEKSVVKTLEELYPFDSLHELAE